MNLIAPFSLVCLVTLFSANALAIEALDTLKATPATAYDLMSYRMNEALKDVKHGKPNVARCSFSEGFNESRMEVRCEIPASHVFSFTESHEIAVNLLEQTREVLGYSSDFEYDAKADRENHGIEHMTTPIWKFFSTSAMDYNVKVALGKQIEAATLLRSMVFTEKGFHICDTTLHRAGYECRFTTSQAGAKMLMGIEDK